MAQQAGYEISLADLTRYQESWGVELDDQELEQVAGGGGDIGAQIFGCLVLLLLQFQDCKWADK
jgi:lactobin A/cerein 7B family class IIb bacteriocin